MRGREGLAISSWDLTMPLRLEYLSNLPIEDSTKSCGHEMDISARWEPVTYFLSGNVKMGRLSL